MESSTTLLSVGLRFQLQGAQTPNASPTQPPAPIAQLIGSSAYHAIADDALKDEDNAGWVMQLEPEIQQEWVERIRWIRLVDRLAESGLTCPYAAGFQDFMVAWQILQQQGTLPKNSPYISILAGMRDRWFDAQGRILQPATVNAWNHYVEAIAAYSVPDLTITSCGDYEQLLNRLAGSFFQVLPFLAEHHRADACQFGVVDQFYNHLRDLQEDMTHGICYFPLELLNEFGLCRADFFTHRVLKDANYYKMMQFWLDVYLPRIRRRVRYLMTSRDLHPSWKTLCDWSVCRYRRIEQVFRECEFDYTRFPHAYWKRVRSELPLMLNAVYRQQAVPSPGAGTLSDQRILTAWKASSSLQTHCPTFSGAILSSAM